MIIITYLNKFVEYSISININKMTLYLVIVDGTKYKHEGKKIKREIEYEKFQEKIRYNSVDIYDYNYLNYLYNEFIISLRKRQKFKF